MPSLEEMVLGEQPNDPDSSVVRVTEMYMKECEESREDREELNRRNLEVFHLKQDYTHKRDGQSREFLGKQALAVEQIVSFFVQGLLDIGDWFGVENKPGINEDNLVFTKDEIRKLVKYYTEKNNIITVIADSIKTGLLQSVMVLKVHGHKVPRSKFVVTQDLESPTGEALTRETKEEWCLKLDLVRPEDYYVDPTGGGVYELQRSFVDMHELMEMAKDPASGFTPGMAEAVAMALSDEEEQKLKKSRETGQDITFIDFRKRVKLVEGWGDIIDPVSGKLLHKDVTWIVANDKFLLKKPSKNPFWHGKSPFITSPLLRVPFSVHHKAVMDAASVHNIALNELYNLMVDAGMMATHGIKQIRPDWLEDEGQVSNGVVPGDTLKVTSSAPPGAKVLERVDTASLSDESLAMYNLINSEFNQSAFTNDLRLGVLPSKSVKATEVVESSNAINNVFNGIVKLLEVNYMERILDMSWKSILQNADNWNEEEIASVIGEERAAVISNMSPARRFAGGVEGSQFKVFGITRTLNKIKDFRKLTALLQTIGASEIMLQEFMKEHSFGRFLTQIMRALDIDTKRIELSPEEKLARQQAQQQQAQQAGVGGANVQSQIPQAAAGGEEILNQQLAGGPQPAQEGEA